MPENISELEQELDYMIDRLKDATTPLRKGQCADIFLEEISDLKKSLSDGRDLKIYSCLGTIPSSIITLTEHYSSGLITKEDALKQMDKMESYAHKYLKERGFDANYAKKMQKEEKENRLKEFKDFIGQSEELKEFFYGKGKKRE